MIKFKATIPYLPPSVNKYWERNRNGSVRVSQKAKQFKDNVADYVFWECDIPETPVFKTDQIKINLTLNFKENRKRDIDNYCKGIFDALTGILWADDSQIVSLHIERNSGTKQPDNFVLEVWED